MRQALQHARQMNLELENAAKHQADQANQARTHPTRLFGGEMERGKTKSLQQRGKFGDWTVLETRTVFHRALPLPQPAKIETQEAPPEAMPSEARGVVNGECAPHAPSSSADPNLQIQPFQSLVDYSTALHCVIIARTTCIVDCAPVCLPEMSERRARARARASTSIPRHLVVLCCRANSCLLHARSDEPLYAELESEPHQRYYHKILGQERRVGSCSSGSYCLLGTRRSAETYWLGGPIPEEREMFVTDVNSTLKIPQQNKDGSHQGGGGQNGRKTSIAPAVGNYPISSPSTATRPGNRRRETTDTNPFPSSAVASPTGSTRFSRDEPWLGRRGTDLREQISDEPEEEVNVREPPVRSQSFQLARGSPAAVSNFGNPASLWGPSAGSATTAATTGAFGNFALAGTSAIGDKRFATGGSRLAHLIPKDSAENTTSKPADAGGADTNRGWRPRHRTDTDPFATDDSVSGSAILGGAQDNSPPSVPSQITRNNIFDTPVKGSAGDFGMAGLNLGSHAEANGPTSPSETNPFRSPLADRGEDGRDEHDLDRLVQTGPTSEPPSTYNTLSRTFGQAAFEGSDRSQTSSVGAKGFPSLNTMTGWPAVPSVGTPDRERPTFNNAFGNNIFSPVNDLPTPGGHGGMASMFGAPGSSIGRGSKLGSLFPPAMQAQMHGHDQENLGDSVPDLRQGNPLGAIGRGPIGTHRRDSGSPVRGVRGAFEDLFPVSENARTPFSTGEQMQPALTATSHAQSFPTTTAGAPYSSVQPAADPATLRTMVMPDRMRWVYLDPQGTMQGPFSGLEMNDWYKANFFTPDLRVKRIEDPEFEPLGQLIRRIGNSREPFLVPQIGIPHGPAPSGGPFAIGGGGAEAVPPLQNAFPSFGRTLTAAQQNDLERRKQEEQLYHARQREISHHHHHPQPFGRMPMQPGMPGALHHHSSAHSLQSQPSFGSMTSPIGMPPQPPIGAIGPNGAFFDGPSSMAPGASQLAIGSGQDNFAPELNAAERQMLANMQATGALQGIYPNYPIGGPAGDAGGLRSQLPGLDELQKDPQGFSARVKEFHDLRAQRDSEELAAAAAARGTLPGVKEEVTEREERLEISTTMDEVVSVIKEVTESAVETTVSRKATGQTQPELSLTERVKRTQADAAAAAAAAVAKPVQLPSTSGLPMPFPPPQQLNTPLAAPTAQRPASNLPSRYGDRSASGTPDTTSDGAALAPPPTAPWAPQPGTETQKPVQSLKEIQEAEAKKAAKVEEALAAQRRSAMELEAATIREREKASAIITGLPATSTWGTGVSPVTTPTTGSAWKQPAVSKGTVAGVASGATPSKKTLADIQREEELRKQKAARDVAAIASAGSALGKRYADLASKGSATPTITTLPVATVTPQATGPVVGGGWSTVGAGGKVKIPTGPAAQTRSTSANNVKGPIAPVVQKVAPRQVSAGLRDVKGAAMDEFKKWLNRELSRGLNGVADIEHFASSLLEMPLDSMILSEAVYGYSTTMDGRHFAEEFVRRKKQAEKGIMEKEPVASSVSEIKNNSNGGWSEVAKKGSSNVAAAKEEAAIPGFKVVPSKKGKGKK
ncbi:hypothetical protein B0T17DRAFT_509305 [Bombardia bombarda]|uniref:GYF domain-containing protein n=1 Tax=Bombardia bombarda TaxID=252184 RepID=A0AA40C1Y6_9PEZI|nr:hypothetical protein B0T17DRAFT_509305 [Bombardia bombarda]